MKSIKIDINNEGQSLLESIRNLGFFLPAYCGARGSCGKCRVRILMGQAPVSDEDRRFFTEEELDEGWRLACMVRGRGSYEVLLSDYTEEEIAAVAAFDSPAEGEDAVSDKTSSVKDQALIVDLGTTTIAASLIDRASGSGLGTATAVNHQRAYGADVLSRIDAANKGQGERLREIITEDLDGLCGKLGLGTSIEDLTMPVIISGNTTMEHLLQGLSCETLGIYPFKAVDLSLHLYKNMTILPGITTFVGADIVSGMVACGMDRKEEISILVDLGTNGEMAIGNRHRILVTSTAAGPAFEGGNISCGMAGLPGAIDRVRIENKKAQVTTIGGKPAVGLCGTGVIETVYELLKAGLIDETGLMDEEYMDQGFPLAAGISFLAKDVRELQLAKAAIRAGIEILLLSYGVTYDQVDRLYLAGGFGQKIDGKKAAGIGLLPPELSDRIMPVGNSSLEGARLFAVNPAVARRFLQVIDISEEINLSNHESFNDYYLDYMFFDGRIDDI